ncbi:MAG TPA: hypothetical protein VHD35_04720 [Chitinophagaceae bacterium]|nr:hypothetical protein [Chitinophagaceae bacterium]
MKKNNNLQNTQKQQELLIQKAINTGGFLFPETVNDVIEFEKKFGNTDVILPEDLKNPSFLESKKMNSSQQGIVTMNSGNYAVAAREGADTVPDSVKKQMEIDRKKADTKRKRKNTKK